MQEAIDAGAGVGGFRGSQLRVVFGQLVRSRQGIDGGADHRVVNGFLHLFTEQVNLETPAPQAVDIVLGAVQRVLEQPPALLGTGRGLKG